MLIVFELRSSSEREFLAMLLLLAVLPELLGFSDRGEGTAVVSWGLAQAVFLLLLDVEVFSTLRLGETRVGSGLAGGYSFEALWRVVEVLREGLDIAFLLLLLLLGVLDLVLFTARETIERSI